MIPGVKPYFHVDALYHSWLAMQYMQGSGFHEQVNVKPHTASMWRKEEKCFGTLFLTSIALLVAKLIKITSVSLKI